MKSKPTFLDLFCGCGGFSLGLQRAGLRGLAAIDFNPEAVAVFRANFDGIPNILEKDLTKFPPSELEAMIGTREVDLIVGGPPCQGFSTARQMDGANHGNRLKADPRRFLYLEFLRYVRHFQPKVFVMENVLGIRSASGGFISRKCRPRPAPSVTASTPRSRIAWTTAFPRSGGDSSSSAPGTTCPPILGPNWFHRSTPPLGTTLWDAQIRVLVVDIKGIIDNLTAYGHRSVFPAAERRR